MPTKSANHRRQMICCMLQLTASPVGAKTRMYLKEQNRFTLKFNSSAILVHLHDKGRRGQRRHQFGGEIKVVHEFLLLF